MSLRAVLPSLLLLATAAFPVDPGFQLVKQDDKVNVYSRKTRDCAEDGAGVLFVVENKTQERLQLKLEILNMKIKNKLTVLVEPAGNTSVLSMSPDAAMCGVELVDMKVGPAPGVEKPGEPLPAFQGG